MTPDGADLRLTVTAYGIDRRILDWLRGTVTASTAGLAPTGTVRFRTGDGALLGETPLGSALQLLFEEWPSGGTAVAEYSGDVRHAPSTSPPHALPESPITQEGPPDA